MQRALLSSALLLCAFIWSAPALAQQEEPPTTSHKPLNAEHRRELYELAKLHERDALWRSALLPGLGNIYADRVFKGVALMATAGMSTGLILGGLLRQERAFVIPGTIGLVTAYSVSLITAPLDVRAYNHELRRRYKVSLSPQGALLRITF